MVSAPRVCAKHRACSRRSSTSSGRTRTVRATAAYEVQTDLALVYLELADLYDRDVRDLA